MELLYRDYLLNQFSKTRGDSSFFDEFWYDAIRQYAKNIGYESQGVQDAVNFLRLMKPADYCGEDYHSETDHYIYDVQYKTLYWFKSINDLEMFVDYMDSGSKEPVLFANEIPQDGFNHLADSIRYRRKVHNGFLYLDGIDVPDIDEILNLPAGISCIENNATFSSVEEAVKWLIASGKAKNEKTAFQNLHKCLNGELKTCCGYHWKDN
jgi:hypothetical protein